MRNPRADGDQLIPTQWMSSILAHEASFEAALDRPTYPPRWTTWNHSQHRSGRSWPVAFCMMTLLF